MSDGSVQRVPRRRDLYLCGVFVFLVRPVSVIFLLSLHELPEVVLDQECGVKLPHGHLIICGLRNKRCVTFIWIPLFLKNASSCYCIGIKLTEVTTSQKCTFFPNLLHWVKNNPLFKSLVNLRYAILSSNSGFSLFVNLFSLNLHRFCISLWI